MKRRPHRQVGSGQRIEQRDHHRRTAGIGVIPVLLICLIILGGGSSFAAPPQSIQIPVIINIYPGSGMTEAKAKKAVAEANKALGKASVKLVVVKVNNPPAGNGGDDGSGGGTAGDGNLTQAEGDKALKFGGEEVDKLPRKKGMKISYVKEPWVERPTPGFSLHRNPTIIVKDRGNDADNGQTLAHEIAHAMTLGPGHKIDDTTTADAAGHAADVAGKSGKKNLMAPSNFRTDTCLTPDQIAEIRKLPWKYGWCSTQFEKLFPAQKQRQGSGKNRGGTQRGGGGPRAAGDSIFEFEEVVVIVVDHLPDVEAEIIVKGLIFSEGEVNASYTLGFDTDADQATGIVHADQPGIDRIVEVLVTGSPLVGTLSAEGTVLDTVLGFTFQLPQAPVITEEFRLAESLSIPTNTSLLLSIPREFLSPDAEDIPVVATAGGLGEKVEFSSNFIFDTIEWQRSPSLTTFGDGTATPGAPYQVGASGLPPNSPFLLYLDDTVVLSSRLDGAGNFSGQFDFPIDVPMGQMHFLTLIPEISQENFAYSFVCPRPTSTQVIPSLEVDSSIQFDLSGVPVSVAIRGGTFPAESADLLERAIGFNEELIELGIGAWTFDDELATNGVLSNFLVVALEPRPFLISRIGLSGEGTVEFAWNSRPGRFYSVEYSTDLIEWLVIDDAFASQGEETVYRYSAENGGPDPSEALSLFFRVGEPSEE